MQEAFTNLFKPKPTAVSENQSESSPAILSDAPEKIVEKDASQDVVSLPNLSQPPSESFEPKSKKEGFEGKEKLVPEPVSVDIMDFDVVVKGDKVPNDPVPTYIDVLPLQADEKKPQYVEKKPQSQYVEVVPSQTFDKNSQPSLEENSDRSRKRDVLKKGLKKLTGDNFKK